VLKNNPEIFACTNIVSVICINTQYEGLPIPPYKKGLYFLLLVNIIKQFQNTVVKAFRIGDGISS
jgi:hypothetical protein